LIYLLSNPFTKILTELLLFLHGIAQGLTLPDTVSPYAVAIIAIAVIVKLLTHPLTMAQQRSMKGMQVLQPKLKELQEAHKDDREQLAQKQMEMYKEHGVNPLGGCLPLIIQMFVLFGLYRAVSNLSHNMTGERFLWIPDLAVCEPNPLCDLSPEPLLFAPIPILVIIMVISQVFYQRLMTPPSTSTDPQAQAMQSAMKYMPFFFAFIFLSLPSALVLYYTLFNILSVLQSAISKRTPATAATTPGGDSPPAEGLTPHQEKKLDERIQRQRRRRKKNG
jgi:YidC/Oxa1 family membrane protein insertase